MLPHKSLRQIFSHSQKFKNRVDIIVDEFFKVYDINDVYNEFMLKTPDEFITILRQKFFSDEFKSFFLQHYGKNPDFNFFFNLFNSNYYEVTDVIYNSNKNLKNADFEKFGEKYKQIFNFVNKNKIIVETDLFLHENINSNECCLDNAFFKSLFNEKSNSTQKSQKRKQSPNSIFNSNFSKYLMDSRIKLKEFNPFSATKSFLN